MRPGMDFCARTNLAVSMCDVIFVLVAEESDAALNQAGGGVTQWAERFAADIIADVQQQVDIFLFALTMLQTFQDLDQPVGSFAARCTLPAGLVAIELIGAQYGP